MRTTRVFVCLLGAAFLAAPVAAADLENELGRNDSRILSEPYPLATGRTVSQIALATRLERMGYTKVAGVPKAPGTYATTPGVFWFYRRAGLEDGADRTAALVGLDLEKGSGRILGLHRDGRSPRPFDEGDVRLEPEVLSESLTGDRAPRLRLSLDAIPERVWRPVLAAEDARFFEHGGVDPRAIARAAFRNIAKGRVAEGGSTLTQQLVKNRDLTPERSLGRKASEAMRAVALEARFDKKQILQAYLNDVYLGHVDGVAVHGLATAARAYYSKKVADLTLAEASSLAAMIQGPNRMSPVTDRAALRERRDWVLSRMEELGWATAAEVARAKASPVEAHPATLRADGPVHLLSWIAKDVRTEGSLEPGRGAVVETTVDPVLQDAAERAVAAHLATLRREYPRLRGGKLSAALVALDARTGAVLAYVGGDPDDAPGAFDRARAAKRQPGSTVKPLVALEALDACDGTPLTASSRVLDAPLRIDLPKGPWEPENFDHAFQGEVPLREVLAESRNIPAVRVARHCGFTTVASVFTKAGLDLPANPPPAFVLGAVETTPLALASAYTVFATPGRRLEPFAFRRAETPTGGTLARRRPSDRRVSGEAAAYIVRSMLRSAVEEGTAHSGTIEGVDVAAKTGTSSEARDAWFAGHAGSIVCVVWVGLDDGRLGLTGAAAAGPLWHDFMARGVPVRPAYEVRRPRDVVEAWVQPSTGLLVGEGRMGARPEFYVKGTLPQRKRWWRIDHPEPAIE